MHGPHILRPLALVGLTLCHLVGAAHAAEPIDPPPQADPVLEPWRWTRYEELAGTGVECVTQTADGAMWFGVDDGVYRYDGLEWTHYGADEGIYGSKVWVLHAGDDGSLYAGTYAGISRYEGQRWQRLFPPEGDVPWNVHDLDLVAGDLWAATTLGLVQLQEDGHAILYVSGELDGALLSMLPYIEPRRLPAAATPSLSWQDVRQPASAGLFVVSNRWAFIGELPAYVVAVAADGPVGRAGLRVGDRIVVDTLRDPPFGDIGATYTITALRTGVADTLRFDVTLSAVDGASPLVPVYDILPADGGLWVSVSHGPVYFFEPDAAADDSARHYDIEGELPRLARTDDGAIWIATGSSDRPLHRIRDGEVESLSAQALGWPGSEIYPSILTAADGALWVGTHVGGLRVLRDGEWSHYGGWGSDALPASAARVTGLHEAVDGSMWLTVRGSEALRLDLSARYTTYPGLWYLGDSDDGSRTFVAGDRVLRQLGDQWSRWPPLGEDSLAAFDSGVTRSGQGWAAGSVDGVAATLIGDEQGTRRTLHPEVSHRVDRGFEAADGSLWFSASVDTRGPGMQAGLLRFDGDRWHHFYDGGAPRAAYGFAQLPNGDLITTGDRLRRFDGMRWSLIDGPVEVTTPYSHSAVVDRHGALWVATRAYGVFRKLGDEWTRYGRRDGLTGGQTVLFRGPDGEAWSGTLFGRNSGPILRFDGSAWVPALPDAIRSGEADYVRAQASDDGALWVQRWSADADTSVAVTRVVFDDQPPQTTIALAADEVSQPGNVVVSWRGADPWRDTPPEQLRFAWRLDGGDWSAFTTATTHTFLELSDGDHTLEVRARDRDLNIDPTPAVARITVVAPVWKQAWFLGMVVVFVTAIAVQSIRVVRRGRRLTAQNRRLTLERAVEGVRAEVMAMASAGDLLKVVGVMHRELLGLGFPGESMSQIHHYDPETDPDTFHAYTAFPSPRALGSSWTSTELVEIDEHTVAGMWPIRAGREWIESHFAEDPHRHEETPDVVRDVFRQTAFGRFQIDRLDDFVEHTLTTHYTCIPFSHGVLGVRANRYLAADEIEVLRAFSDALSLGFTRFRDFQQLEQASVNKSQFLRRMSHDLRSPMNAILGYTRILRRRLAERMDEREARNLANIETSSGNLLHLINDVLDLSRIEAGRIEVRPRPVDVRQLTDECADALESIVKEGVVLRRELNDVGMIDSDPDRLRQVLMNLLGNATKFTDVGSITLSLARQNGAGVEISVTDTGIGIPADDLPHIFDEFRQVERQGGNSRRARDSGWRLRRRPWSCWGVRSPQPAPSARGRLSR